MPDQKGPIQNFLHKFQKSYDSISRQNEDGGKEGQNNPSPPQILQA